MRKILLDSYLCCPVDRSYPLSVEDAEWVDDELISGLLICPGCSSCYPVESFIPNFLPRDLREGKGAAAKQRELQARDADAPVYDNYVPDYQTSIEINALVRALNVKPGDLAVDLGAGTGRLTLELARRGAMVLALDISPRSLQVNRSKCKAAGGMGVHFIVADACALPLRAAAANRVGSGMMIEHLPTTEDRQNCIEEIYRIMRPDGRLALTAYNYSWGKRRPSRREGFHGGDLYYYCFERDELRRMLAKYNVQRMTALLNLPASVRVRPLDTLISAVPPLASQTGELLFVVAEPKAAP